MINTRRIEASNRLYNRYKGFDLILTPLCLCLCLCVCLQGEVLPVGGGAEPAVSGPAAHPAVVQVHHGRRPLLQLLAGGHAYHHLQPVQGKPNRATGPVYPVWVIKPP